MRNTPLYIFLFLTIASLGSCSDDFFEGGDGSIDSRNKIELSGEIDQIYQTRVNDNGFCDGDVMGTYIVDYDGETPGTLQLTGNRADNLKQTYDEASNKWTSAYDVYWKDKHTAVDIYGYYPFGQPESIDAYSFSVERDQSTETEGDVMGGYEASDFLWGKVENVAPTSNTIRLPLSHRMATARVTLIEGTGFNSGEWAQTEKSILQPNLIRQASIDLSTGLVTASGSVESTATVPFKKDDEWRSIVVPQTVKAQTTLFSITIGGIPYKFSKSTDFTFTAGKMSNFGIKVDKKMATGDYQLTLISESITAWENDQVSHDATAREYIVINSTRKHLKDSIAAKGLDYTKIQNLKIKGVIDIVDFEFMRDEMSSLQSLNLKEAISWGQIDGASSPVIEYAIPIDALYQKSSLMRLVLPDKLIGIGGMAFDGCSNLMGSLEIPEGVTTIGGFAFSECGSLLGSLSLPSTLKIIGASAFNGCGFTGNLLIPNSVTEISGNAFYGCGNLTGNLILPDNLTKLGEWAFFGCSGLTGNLVIPQSLHEIESSTFFLSGFNGVLQLHDGITSIGEKAFAMTSLKGELVLPKNLSVIESRTFEGCNFSGTLKIPETVGSIKDQAFYGCTRLTGVIEFPDELQQIGSDAFCRCTSLAGIVIPEGVDVIKSGAFSDCFYLNSIVCEGTIPPTLMSGVFNGVAKDNFALEVPETAINSYKTATGWCDFKRITAHHELVCRTDTVCALNASRSETLVIDAEGDWEVQSKPSWCSLSQTSGSKKSEITLTINALPKGADDREGEIVFKLKDLDYTHSCVVKQRDYSYSEDQWICLQNATKGSNGGINVVIIGDGFDVDDIADGTYLDDMKQKVEYLFDIEPYTTYRNYFNIYTAICLSQESGVETVNTIVNNKFGTRFTSGSSYTISNDDIFSFVLGCPTVTQSNLCQTLIILVPNATDYGGVTHMWSDGSAIAVCPTSDDEYPYDTRGVVQHEAGGHGFGKLADEYIYHNAYIDACNCPCCPHDDYVKLCKSYGWYDNISLTGKMHEVPWSHFIFDDDYIDRVDVYEGAYMHMRGVFRSEQTSCMNNNIPYFSTISRESIVKRIKQYAGETYSLSDFKANDVKDASTVTRSGSRAASSVRTTRQNMPVVHKGSPRIKAKKKSSRH